MTPAPACFASVDFREKGPVSLAVDTNIQEDSRIVLGKSQMHGEGEKRL